MYHGPFDQLSHGQVILRLGLPVDEPLWWIHHPSLRHIPSLGGHGQVSLGGALPLRLVGRALPVTLPPSRAKRREEGLVAAAWGALSRKKEPQ